MCRTKWLSFLMLLGLCTTRSESYLWASKTAQVVPPFIDLTGTALGSDGKPLAGEIEVLILAYKSQTGGEPLWMESQKVSLNGTGQYVLRLGANTQGGLPWKLFDSRESLWVEIQIGGEQPQNRVMLVSVPYAFKASDAAMLGGIPAENYVLREDKSGSMAPSSGNTNTGVVVTANGAATGYLPKFSTSSSVINSQVFDTGSDVGVGTSSPAGKLDVNGTTIIRGVLTTTASASIGGQLSVLGSGQATSSKGVGSHSLSLVASSFNSAVNTPVAQTFQLVSYPIANNTSSASGALEFLFGQGTASPKPTGLSIGSNGRITFAPGQTFPGGASGITGITAGTGLVGGGSSGNLSLALDTQKVPLLNSNNSFVGNQSVSGSLSSVGSFSTKGQLMSTVATGTPPLVVQSTTAIPNLNASLLSGLPATSFATLNTSNSFAGTQTFEAVQIGGGLNPFTQLNIEAEGSRSGLSASGSYNDQGNGTTGVVGEGGIGVVSGSGNNGTGGIGGVFEGGMAYGSNRGGDGLAAIAGEADSDQWGYAGYFGGDVYVTGAIASGAQGMTIDHPLEPATKYLEHSAVGSSEMMNIYSGNVTTDQLGLATVALPAWFESLNRDYRYQLTVLDKFAQAIVAKKIANHQFSIRTNASFTEVSWQVTAVRQDAYAIAHPLRVEHPKSPVEKGFFAHPELHGASRDHQIAWARNPELMSRLRSHREQHRVEAIQPHP